MDYSFSEAIAISNEEGWGIAEGGLDMVFNVLEHISDGGTVDNFTLMDTQGTQVMLALIWAEVRWAVMSRSQDV